jgi:hypothetical protein
MTLIGTIQAQGQAAMSCNGLRPQLSQGRRSRNIFLEATGLGVIVTQEPI